MAVKIEEFVAYLGFEVDASALKEFKKQVKETAIFFKQVATAVVGATAALTGYTIITNKQTRQVAALAESVGITVDAVIALEGLAFALGKDSETVIDLVEEMNNKFGEMKGLGELTSLQEGVKLLGLEYKNLKDLNPEQQFLTILDAAKELDDQQRAASGVDMIFGGEANKIIGSIRQIDGSLASFIEQRKQLNFLSEEGIEQAKAFSNLWGSVETIAKTVSAEFAALLGQTLKPLLIEFLKFVQENRDLIKVRIAEWAERLGRFLEVVFRILRWGVLVINDVASALGGLENVLALIAGIFAGIGLVKVIKLFETLSPLIDKAVKAVKALDVATVKMAAKWVAAAALIVLAGLAVNSLIRYFQGKDSLVGDLGVLIAEQMEIGMDALAEFFGFSKDEFQRWLVVTVDIISDVFSTAWKIVSEFFERFASMSWSDVFNTWIFIFKSYIEDLRNLWSSFADWLVSVIPTKILTAFRNMFQQVRSWVSEIPFVGGIVKGGTAAAGAQPVQVPSTAALQTATQSRDMRRTVNNLSKRSGDIYIDAPMSITQREGESGEGLARRIETGIRTEFAQAIRDNDTGVDY